MRASSYNLVIAVALAGLFAGVAAGRLLWGGDGTGRTGSNRPSREKVEELIEAKYAAESEVTRLQAELARQSLLRERAAARLSDDRERMSRELDVLKSEVATLRRKDPQQIVAPRSEDTPVVSSSVQMVGDAAGAIPVEDDWQGRYKYAVYKYNQLVGHYDRLQKKYMELTGADGGARGVTTGAQFYRMLMEVNSRDIDELSKTIRRGVPTNRKREMDMHRRELEDRRSWLKDMASKQGLIE